MARNTWIEFGIRWDERDGRWALLTVPEVCLLWGKTPKSVMMALYTGRLSGRPSVTGGSWLVELTSVFKLWGDPEYTPISPEERGSWTNGG
jgi:hypothetical protein